MAKVIALVVVDEGTEVGIAITKDDTKLARQSMRFVQDKDSI